MEVDEGKMGGHCGWGNTASNKILLHRNLLFFEFSLERKGESHGNKILLVLRVEAMLKIDGKKKNYRSDLAMYTERFRKAERDND